MSKVVINSLEDLVNNSCNIPLNVMADINSRITDWIARGGNENDPYIMQQLKYAERVINLTNSN